MAVLKTSQEINKSRDTFHNKFYRGRKMIPYPAIERGSDIWFCQIAVPKHDDGLVCPFCGGKPNATDWEDKIEYKGFDGELHICTTPYIVSNGSCASCGKWWVVRSNPDAAGAVVQYDVPRTCDDYDVELAKATQRRNAK